MSDELVRIIESAESLAEKYSKAGKVNLNKIIKHNDITVIHKPYGEESFLGQLVHVSNSFYIYLNKDLFPKRTHPRARFTIAHELGHFFIAHHRESLETGISLSTLPNSLTENEANHFASYLLMPRSQFVPRAKKFDSGIPAILSLKEHFGTSIECTALQYVRMDIMPCMFIKWRSDLTHHYTSYSASFATIAELKGKPNIKVSDRYIQNTFSVLESLTSSSTYFEEETNLSMWLGTVSAGTKKDFPVLAQTFRSGIHGGLTFLTYNN